MLKYLIASMSDYDFFGNYVSGTRKIANRLQFLTLYPSRAKELVRRRGYRDGKSGGTISSSVIREDWSFTLLQNELEREQDFRERTLNCITEYGLLGVRLPETERLEVWT